MVNHSTGFVTDTHHHTRQERDKYSLCSIGRFCGPGEFRLKKNSGFRPKFWKIPGKLFLLLRFYALNSVAYFVRIVYFHMIINAIRGRVAEYDG